MNDVVTTLGGLIAAPLPSSPPLVKPWQSELLSSIPGVAHGVTRRVEGLGRADGNIGFSPPRDRGDAWAMRRHWCAALDLVPEHLVTLGQIHGRDIRIATKAHAGYGARPLEPTPTRHSPQRVSLTGSL